MFRGKGLFVQFSCYMNMVVKLGVGNFIGCILFCGLGGNFSFCVVQCGGSGVDVLSKVGSREQRQCSNSNESFDEFYGCIF